MTFHEAFSWCQPDKSYIVKVATKLSYGGHSYTLEQGTKYVKESSNNQLLIIQWASEQQEMGAKLQDNSIRAYSSSFYY